MLIGQYEGTISSKFQVAFPKKFRESLGNSLIITKGLENCLIIVSAENWKTLLEGTIEKPFIDKSTREMQRFLLGNATDITLDAKGRCVLPSYLREYAHLEEIVIFAGIGKFIEVWDKEFWNIHQFELTKRIASVAERIGKEIHE